MGGVTSTTFGLLIAYLLPGLIAVFGTSLWFPSVSRVFSTFLTAKSNAGLFLLVILAALTAGLFIGMIRWLLLDSTLCRRLFAKERMWLRKWTSPALPRPSPSDYSYLAREDRLSLFKAFIDETYRYYQFWAGTAIAMPIVLSGWLSSLDSSLPVSQLLLLILGVVLIEVIILAKALDSYVSMVRGHTSIVKGEEGGNK